MTIRVRHAERPIGLIGWAPVILNVVDDLTDLGRARADRITACLEQVRFCAGECR